MRAEEQKVERDRAGRPASLPYRGRRNLNSYRERNFFPTFSELVPQKVPPRRRRLLLLHHNEEGENIIRKSYLFPRSTSLLEEFPSFPSPFPLSNSGGKLRMTAIRGDNPRDENWLSQGVQSRHSLNQTMGVRDF